MSPLELNNLLHLALLLGLALAQYIIAMSRKSLVERIVALEALLDEFRQDLEDQTPTLPL